MIQEKTNKEPYSRQRNASKGNFLKLKFTIIKQKQRFGLISHTAVIHNRKTTFTGQQVSCFHMNIQSKNVVTFTLNI